MPNLHEGSPDLVPDEEDMNQDEQLDLVNHATRPRVAPAPCAPPFKYPSPLNAVVSPMAARLPKDVAPIARPRARLLTSKVPKLYEVAQTTGKHRPWLRPAVTGNQWTLACVASVYEDAVNNRCKLCGTTADTLEHRF